MANLQYIGARYVPIVFDNPDDHSAAWKSGVSYENLVIVTYLDDSYTSRKPVPASVGNPADNPDYWAKTGDFNAALSNLQNQVNTLDTEMQNVSDIVDNLDRPFENCTFLLMGDSYAAHTQWPTIFTNMLNGGNAIDITEGSRTFVSNYTYLDKLQTFVNSSTQATLNSIDYLILLGGIGDSDPTRNSNLSTAIETFLTYAREHLTNAKIYLGYIGGGLNGYGGPGETGPATPLQRLRAMNLYELSSSLYISGINNVVNNFRWYYGTGMDGLHPVGATGIGYYIADYLYNYLATGSASYTVADVNSATVGNTSNVKIEAFQDDNITEVKIAPFTVTLDTQIGEQGVDKYKICSLPAYVPIWGSDLVDKDISVFGGTNDGLTPLSFYIYQHELYVTCMQRQLSNQWWNIPSGTSFDVPELIFRMDTAMVLKKSYNTYG